MATIVSDKKLAVRAVAAKAAAEIAEADEYPEGES
jgi:hypothetical protein